MSAIWITTEEERVRQARSQPHCPHCWRMDPATFILIALLFAIALVEPLYRAATHLRYVAVTPDADGEKPGNSGTVATKEGKHSFAISGTLTGNGARP